jgi:hypothetical protein
MTGSWLRSRITLFLLSFLATTGHAKLFVPDIEPWDIWVPFDASNQQTIAHGEWQALLDTYLVTDTADGIYRFDYAGVSAKDQERLQAYINTLAHIDPQDYPRDEQLAYWINLYNALTVAVVLEHYPVKSIRKIYGGILNTGPWDTPLIEVAGVPLTLNDIEHRILRPIWRDPRIHYAVNCASLGCPNLAAQAYNAANAEQLLDAGARDFINSPHGVAFKNNRIEASSIYNWYDTDFGNGESGLLQHWLEYANPELAAQLEGFDGRISYDYDWSLNEP